MSFQLAPRAASSLPRSASRVASFVSAALPSDDIANARSGLK